MLPMLRADDLIAVELTPPELSLGDILVFRQLDYLVVHRYLGPATREDGHPVLRTRGDNIATLDPPLDRSRVRGRVVAFQSDGLWWSAETSGARIWAMLIALHDLCWAFTGSLARAIDRRAVRIGFGKSLAAGVAALDRLKLRLAYRLLFRLLHHRCEAPSGARLDPDLATSGPNRPAGIRSE